MREIPIEKLLETTSSKYALATVLGKRTKQINRGSKILVDDVSGKSVGIAMKEVASGLVPFAYPGEE